MSPTARQIAEVAVHEAERPERERQQRVAAERARKEKLRERAQKRKDTMRLNRSPLKDWFPGVEWKVIDHMRIRDGTVYESQEEDEHDRIRLTIFKPSFDNDVPKGYKRKEVVAYTPYKTTDRWDTNNRIIYDHSGTLRGHEEWSGPLVNSRVDVGREMRKWQERVSPPAGARLGAEGYPVY